MEFHTVWAVRARQPQVGVTRAAVCSAAHAVQDATAVAVALGCSALTNSGARPLLSSAQPLLLSALYCFDALTLQRPATVQLSHMARCKASAPSAPGHFSAFGSPVLCQRVGARRLQRPLQCWSSSVLSHPAARMLRCSIAPVLKCYKRPWPG